MTVTQSIKSQTGVAAATQPRVAVIGCGHWGKNHVRNFAKLGALRAVCDADAEQAARLAEEYSVPAMSFVDVLASKDVDAVVIAAPAEQHFGLARDALEAGKHVFVEKPLALDVRNAETLSRLADDCKRVLMVGHLLQYHPAYIQLQAFVKKGELGRLQYIYSNRLNLGKIRREENILWSFAPHDISMILSLVGEEPEAVSAFGSEYLHEKIADVTTTNLRFPSGACAHVFVSWLHPFKEQKLIVIGDRAMAVFDDGRDWSDKLTVYRHQISWRDGAPSPIRADGEPVALPVQEPLEAECRHFLDCVASGERPRTDGYEGVRVLKVLTRAEQSMTSGRRSPEPNAQAAGDSDYFAHESAYVDEGVTVGPGTKIWHFSHVLPGSQVGSNVNIGQNVVIGPDVSVGNNCKIQNNVSLYKGVVLEDGVFCGPSSVFTNVNNPRAEINRQTEFRQTIVRRGATIGANATIVCGHELGEYCFIAAGAVVTGDVPAYALLAGVPARRIGWMSRAGERLGPDLVCPSTGAIYKLVDDDRIEPQDN